MILITSIFQILTLVFSSCVFWFESVLTATGLSGLFLAGVFFVLLSKFILSPVFGSAGSDKVKKKNQGD